jgi:RNA polymerase-binding transcription factor DksA
VAAALRRLRDGTYGFCVDCGQPIEEGRLLALPAAALCTGCATVHERIAGR